LGTPFYLPIEILTGEKYSSKCDVFSVGIVLYEMVFLNLIRYMENIHFMQIKRLHLYLN